MDSEEEGSGYEDLVMADEEDDVADYVNDATADQPAIEWAEDTIVCRVCPVPLPAPQQPHRVLVGVARSSGDPIVAGRFAMRTNLQSTINDYLRYTRTPRPDQAEFFVWTKRKGTQSLRECVL